MSRFVCCLSLMLGLVLQTVVAQTTTREEQCARSSEREECRAVHVETQLAGHVPRSDTVTEISSPAEYRDFLTYLDKKERSPKLFPADVVQRHVGALISVLPESMAESLNLLECEERGEVDVLPDDAGSRIAAWWRRQDPLPADEGNQRLKEHLIRTTHAFKHYTREDDANRLDDRGRVYVRYGNPLWHTEINSGKEGAFWIYPELHDAAEFLFVREQGDGYQFGRPTDFVGRGALSSQMQTRRGRSKTLGALSQLEDVYSTLAQYRSRYGITYSDIRVYRQKIREAQMGLRPKFTDTPDMFLRQKVQEIKVEERQAERRRDKKVPRTETDVGEEIEDLPVAARPVRTLTSEGETVVDVFWGIDASALPPSRETTQRLTGNGKEPGSNYLLSATFVEQSETYEQQEQRSTHLLVSRPEDEKVQQRIPTRQFTFSLDSTTAHASLQVDEYWAALDQKTGARNQAVNPLARFKSGVKRVDSLDALRTDPSVLEMSDLKPLYVDDDVPLDSAQVYPHETFPRSASLALEFEVYHLSFGPGDRTKYSVEYRILRRTEDGGLVGLFRDDDEKKTAVQSTSTGDRRRTREVVLLELREWNPEERQDIRVEVEVEDKNTGRSVQRAVNFELLPNE